jgi:hypothetical protein
LAEQSAVTGFILRGPVTQEGKFTKGHLRHSALHPNF